MPKFKPRPPKLRSSIRVGDPQLLDAVDMLSKNEMRVYVRLIQTQHVTSTPVNSDFGGMPPRCVRDALTRLEKHGLIRLSYERRTKRTIEVL